MFFGLNLAFNGVVSASFPPSSLSLHSVLLNPKQMWTLFTKALARGSSTTQVSIMNTSANFVITALLGLAIFAENLPPLWWLGAALLVAGNVIIGRKDDGGGGGGGDDEDNDEDDGGAPSPSEPSPPSPSASPRPGDEAMPQVDTVLPAKDKPEDEDVPLIGDVEAIV